MNPFRCLVLAAAVCLLAGCTATTYEYSSQPEVSTVKSTDFKLDFSPEKKYADYFSSFMLTLENLSGQPLEIDWNKTLYLFEGKNYGGFWFDGIDPEDIKSATVPPDVVQPGAVISKEIMPRAAVARSRDHKAGTEGDGISGGILPAGENSIFLVLRVNDAVVRKKLSVVITEGRK